MYIINKTYVIFQKGIFRLYLGGEILLRAFHQEFNVGYRGLVAAGSDQQISAI